MSGRKKRPHDAGSTPPQSDTNARIQRRRTLTYEEGIPEEGSAAAASQPAPGAAAAGAADSSSVIVGASAGASAAAVRDEIENEGNDLFEDQDWDDKLPAGARPLGAALAKARGTLDDPDWQSLLGELKGVIRLRVAHCANDGGGVQLSRGVLAKAKREWSLDDARERHVLQVLSATRLQHSIHSVVVSDGDHRVTMTTTTSAARAAVLSPLEADAPDRPMPMIAKITFTTTRVGLFVIFRATSFDPLPMNPAKARGGAGTPEPLAQQMTLEEVALFDEQAVVNSPGPGGFRSPDHLPTDPTCCGHDCRKVYSDPEKRNLVGDAGDSPRCVLVDHPLPDFMDVIPDMYRPPDGNPSRFSAEQRRWVLYFHGTRQVWCVYGYGIRAILPDCYVLAIRRKYPDLLGNYTGHVFGANHNAEDSDGGSGESDDGGSSGDDDARGAAAAAVVESDAVRVARNNLVRNEWRRLDAEASDAVVKRAARAAKRARKAEECTAAADAELERDSGDGKISDAESDSVDVDGPPSSATRSQSVKQKASADRLSPVQQLWASSDSGDSSSDSAESE